MPYFSIRVELQDGNAQHYVDMANDLARKGITDVVTSRDGTLYKMSQAEYIYEGNASIDDVLNAVRASANKTGRTNAVFVTQAIHWKWIGLAAVQSLQSA
jgi:hypothetical protein